MNKIRPLEIKKIGDDIYVKWAGKKKFVKIDDDQKHTIAAFIILNVVYS
jgi:hypothetical protein